LSTSQSGLDRQTEFVNCSAAIAAVLNALASGGPTGSAVKPEILWKTCGGDVFIVGFYAQKIC